MTRTMTCIVSRIAPVVTELAANLVIRRVKGVFLRTRLPAGDPVTDTGESAAEAAWWAAAYPEVSAATREKMVLRARRRAR
jgi:hypothetical protein